MSQLVKTKRQANFKGFKRFGAFKGLDTQTRQINYYLQRLIIQSDQQENKSRVLLYRNVFLSLIVHICIVAMHSCFIGCLPLEKSIINQLLIINTLTHFTTNCGITVAHNYRKRP
jgi:hypothetical protein